jgi:hypothetical protein
MDGDSASKVGMLADKDIVSGKKVARRSLLASTGIGFAAGVAAIALGTKIAHASDKKTGDMRDRSPPDPTRVDTD